MTITKTKNGTALRLVLEGRLDTTTAPALEAELKEELPGVTDLTLDFEKLVYVSSAGLRVLLGAQKAMKGQGEMILVNVCEDIKEVFDITGFSDILHVQ